MTPRSTTARRAVCAGLTALGLLWASTAARTTSAAPPPGPGDAASPSSASAQSAGPGARPRGQAQAQAQKKKPGKGGARKGGALTPKRGVAGASQGRAAAANAPPERPSIELSLAVQRTTLDNGLRVVMSVDRSLPTVAVAVTYDVGSHHEEPGKSGFARLFERMMFQGSKNVPKGGHAQLVAARGGVFHGATSTDHTAYLEVVPASELPLALWLEADRMRSLDISEQNLESERRSVQQEHRESVAEVAYASSESRLQELVFQGYWPYEHDTFGAMADLDAARLESVRDFFAAHYGPGHAVLTIAGDFDADAALGLVQKYFGGIPKGSAAPFQDAPFPEQTSQRTAVVKDRNARAPGVLYGWPAPPLQHPDHGALEIGAILLGGGESSRLHQILVREKAVAVAVRVRLDGRRGPDLFSIDAQLTEGARVGDVERLIEGEIKALSTRGPTDAELVKARRWAQAAFLAGLEGSGARARKLGEYELAFGDASRVNGELQRYAAVTREDVQRVVRAHLGPIRRTIVETYPPTAAAPAGETRGGAPATKRGNKVRASPRKKPVAKPKRK